MSKLPTDFVKAPATAAGSATATKPKARAPRARKASLISPDPVRDPRELMLHLTDEEHRALEEARQRLHEAGTEITLEQMIHRVFADWMVRARAAVQPPPASTANSASTATAAPRDEHLVARLRAFVAEPLRMWRELAAGVWRATYLRRG